MSPNNKARNGAGPETITPQSGLVVMESSRAACPPKEEKGEERLGLFWRVFGGTLLSIAALVLITVYQQISGGLHGLRAGLNHVTEVHADFVKKDEFSARNTSLWNGIKELQAANATVSALKERASLLEQQLKQAEDERKGLVKKDEMAGQIAAVSTSFKEAQAACAAVITAKKEEISGQINALGTSVKELQTAGGAVTVLKERVLGLEEKLKLAEEERREMVREMQKLRERLATVEGRQNAAGPPKPADE